MLRAKRILFPTDFSASSDAALDRVCHWTRKLEAEVYLFHVLESLRPDLYPAALGVSDPAVASLNLEQHAAAEMEVRRRLASSQGVAVTCAMAPGLAAAPAILDYAETHDIDLIAMSTHGRRGVRRLLLGSVAEEVVQRSSCPVLTIAADRSSHHPWPQRILVAVDLSDHSSAVVAYGKELAMLFRAELQLLHVVVRTPLPAYYDGAGLPMVMFDSPLLEREAQGALETLHQNAGGPPGLSSVHVEHGVAVEQILRFATVNSSDLILVASHGLTGVAHLLMGSVSERVVRQAPCPVLTIKSFGKSLIDLPAAAATQAAGPRPNGGRRQAPPHRAC